MTDEENPLTLIFSRNRFYRRQYFFALGTLCLNLIVITLLISVLFFLKRNPTKPVYFATDVVGRLIQVVPVSEPNMKLEEVMQWAVEAVEATYSYDFVNYRTQMQNSQKYFTYQGWSSYIAALTASNNLVALRERSMVVIARVVSQPTLVTQGLLGGAYAYKLEVPVLITYMLPPYDEKSRFSNALNVSLVIQRQPILQSYNGLGILQLLATFTQKATSEPNELGALPAG